MDWTRASAVFLGTAVVGLGLVGAPRPAAAEALPAVNGNLGVGMLPFLVGGGNAAFSTATAMHPEGPAAAREVDTAIELGLADRLSLALDVPFTSLVDAPGHAITVGDVGLGALVSLVDDREIGVAATVNPSVSVPSQATAAGRRPLSPGLAAGVSVHLGRVALVASGDVAVTHAPDGPASSVAWDGTLSLLRVHDVLAPFVEAGVAHDQGTSPVVAVGVNYLPDPLLILTLTAPVTFEDGAVVPGLSLSAMFCPELW